MKTRRFMALFAVSALVLVLTSVLAPISAQDMFDGRFTFNVPSGFEVNESLTNDTIRLEGNNNQTIVVIGPESYTQVLGDETFATEDEELAFYLDRTGYTVLDVGSIPATAANQVAESRGVELGRRGVRGAAALVDLGNDRSAVVIAIGPSGTPRATSVVLESLSYPADILDVADNAGGFTVLLAAVQELGLEDTLRGDGPFTVFAPTDEAFFDLFVELGVDSPSRLIAEDPDLVENILLYHVVSGEEIMLPASGNLATLNGELPLSLTVGEGVNVVTPNIEAYNGVIHVIDSVLIPPADEETEE